MSDPQFVWLLLALTSTFAVNLTLFWKRGQRHSGPGGAANRQLEISRFFAGRDTSNPRDHHIRGSVAVGLLAVWLGLRCDCPRVKELITAISPQFTTRLVEC